VKLTKSRKKGNTEKEREVEERKEKRKGESTKENIRERWWVVKEKTREPNL
jgi:hypothetical protein